MIFLSNPKGIINSQINPICRNLWKFLKQRHFTWVAEAKEEIIILLPTKKTNILKQKEGEGDKIRSRLWLHHARLFSHPKIWHESHFHGRKYFSVYQESKVGKYFSHIKWSEETRSVVICVRQFRINPICKIKRSIYPIYQIRKPHCPFVWHRGTWCRGQHQNRHSVSV